MELFIGNLYVYVVSGDVFFFLTHVLFRLISQILVNSINITVIIIHFAVFLSQLSRIEPNTSSCDK